MRQILFEPWQLGQEYREWQTLKKRDVLYPLRFGQWFINRHQIEGHSELYNETDANNAYAYIQHHFMDSAMNAISSWR